MLAQPLQQNGFLVVVIVLDDFLLVFGIVGHGRHSVCAPVNVDDETASGKWETLQLRAEQTRLPRLIWRLYHLPDGRRKISSAIVWNRGYQRGHTGQPRVGVGARHSDRGAVRASGRRRARCAGRGVSNSELVSSAVWRGGANGQLLARV